MSYSIIATPTFEKDVKKLKKKYSKIKTDISSLVKEIYKNPVIGTSLGENLYKIRVPNSSIPVGKRSGFRVITYYITDKTLYLMTIYSKNDKDDISISEINNILQEIN